MEQNKDATEPLGGGENRSNISNVKEEDLQKLLKKNFELNSEIFKMVKYIKKYIFWQKIWGVLKVLIILVPIILSIIYLPPFLNKVFSQYKGLFEGVGVLKDVTSNIPEDSDLGSIMKSMKNEEINKGEKQ